MKNRRNYYRLLQVQPDAPVQIIKASYRTMMRELRLHPDLGGSSDLAAALNQAYAVLCDPARRSEYDRELSIKFGRRSPSASGSEATALGNTRSCFFCGTAVSREPREGESCPACESPLASMQMASLEEESRRSVARMKREDQLVYYSQWPDKGRKGKLVDLSTRGLRFSCSEDIPLRRILKLSSPLFEAVGSVRNIRKDLSGGLPQYSIGVVFIVVKFGSAKGIFLSTRA